MKKLTIQQLLFLFLSLFYLSCEEQNPELKAANKTDLFEVKDGILVFNDRLAFQKTVSEFNHYSLEDLQKWEQGIEGFKSLRSTFNEVDSVRQLPVSISSVLNEAGVFQVGDTIVLLDNNVEYLIPGEDAEVLKQIKNSISNGLEIDDERFVKRIVKAQSVPLGADEKQSSDNALYWIDARYQKQFYAPKADHTYKQVFEVFVYDYFYYIQLEVRSKLEYEKKRRFGRDTWEPAGETTEKSISNLVIQGNQGNPLSPNFYITAPYLYRKDNRNLVYMTAFAADWIADLQVSGYFFSKIIHPNIDDTPYVVPNAYWYKDFLSK